MRKTRQEDENDRHASLDFGLGEVHRKGRGGATVGGAEYGSEEKIRPRQLSMDMASPYLLPPELQNSRESLHSLSRNLNNKEDPYRPVAQYYNDNASMRSARIPKGGASSIYTGSSGTPSRLQESSTAELLGNAARMSRSGPPAAFIPPPRQNSLLNQSASTSPDRSSLGKLPYMNGTTTPPEIQMPQPVARKGLGGLPTSPRPGYNAPTSGLSPSASSPQENRESYMGSDAAALRYSNNYLGAFINREASPAPPPAPSKSPERSREVSPAPLPAPSKSLEPIQFSEAFAMPETPAMEEELAPVRRSPPMMNSLPSNPRPERKQLPPPVAQEAVIEDGSDYGEGFMITPPSPGHEERQRGQRYSMDVPPEEFANAGLGAPGFDPKRLSMGFRPLPPNAATEHDDPEVRANRIRSFYKEYFDESKPAPQGQYYEDYDQQYMGEAPAQYYDQYSNNNYNNNYDPNGNPNGYNNNYNNNYVMPYAEPINRRAMTPPPQGQRFMGQGQGPSRSFHGSMGGNSMRGPPMMPPGPRPYSSASNRMQGPRARAQSSASNRGPPRGRPVPPPAALTTLPTPSKLRDDSFAIFGAADFAPPPTYQDRQAGRSQSPLGERREYAPAVPAYKPLATSFEDLAPMPSP